MAAEDAKPAADMLAVRALVNLCSAVMTSFLIAIQYPVMPYLGEQIGATKAQVGTVYAVFPAGQVLGQAVCGRCADAYGRKPTLIVFGLAMAATCLLFVYASTPEQLIASGFVAGIAGSTWPVCRTVIVDMMDKAELPRWMGVANICMTTPYVIGPFVSGRIAKATGNYRLPFALIAIGNVLVCVLIAIVMVETKKAAPAAGTAGAAGGNGGDAPSATVAARRGAFACTVYSLGQPILCWLGYFCTQGIQVAYLSSFTPLVKEAYGWEVGQTSNAFAVFSSIMILCSVVTTAHNTVKKMGLLTSGVIGSLLITCAHYTGSLLHTPLDSFYGYPMLVILMFSWCLGKVTNAPAILTMASDAVPAEVQGTFQGGMSAFGSTGGFAMTSAYHLIADEQSYRVSMRYMSMSICVALIIMTPSIWLARHHKQKTTYDPARLLI